MGSLNPFKTPKVEELGKTQFQLDQEKRMAELTADKAEEHEQKIRGRRGRRSLLSNENTGSGYIV